MANLERNDPIEEIAGSIADGQDIDWEELERKGTVSSEELRSLQVVYAMVRRQWDDTVFDPASHDSSPKPLESGFDILEELGQGKFGQVYLAVDRSLHRKVALKVIHDDLPVSQDVTRRFVQEARVLASLDHPNIVRIYSIEEKDRKLRLSLEHIEGRTLDRVLAEDGPYAPEEAARVGIDLCRALACLHGKGLIHRDLKPSNVMRAQGGRIVLLDFGFASSIDDEDLKGSNPGTPLVMAPEQFQPSGRISARTDLYALGVVLYWLVCGAYPYRAKTILELREQVLAGRYIPLLDQSPSVPTAYAALVATAMAHRPEERFASAGEMEAALRGFLAREEAKPTSKRRPLLWALGAVAILLVAWIAYFLQPSPFAFDARLYARRADGDVPLQSGDAIRAEDQFYLKLAMNRDAHVYVFNEDNNGHIFRLFPLPGLQENPLRAGEDGYIPRVGDEDRTWEINVPGGGRETIVILASSTPMQAVEELLKQIPAAMESSEVEEDTSPISAEILRDRGMGELSAKTVQRTSAQVNPAYRLKDLFLELRDDSSMKGDTVIQAIELKSNQ